MKPKIVLLLLACLAIAGCRHLGERAPPVLHVMTSGGFTEALRRLQPRFERETGIRLQLTYGASTGGAPDSIPERLRRGETADVVILARENLDELAARGWVSPEGVTDLVRSRIGLAVRAGAAVPDIGTPEKFVALLRSTPSLAYSASASGTYLSGELFPRLGLRDELAPRSIRVVSERVGNVVARGEAALGFQQVSELLPIPGIVVVGPIPEAYQKVTTFSAGLGARSGRGADAGRLLRFLQARPQAEVIAATGLEPIGPPRRPRSAP